MLFAFDRFYVHAAAVELHGRVHVFVGRGSFGKSTTCLALAKRAPRSSPKTTCCSRATVTASW